MTFTYLIANDIGKVRLEIGDTIENSGVYPDGSNLSDEEIQVLLDREGAVMKAAAGACELLARRWAREIDTRVGERQEKPSTVSAAWLKQAEQLRADFGYGAGSGASGSFVTRQDGYSDDLAAEET